MKTSWMLGLAGLVSLAVGIMPVLKWPQDQSVASYATSLAGRTPNQRHNAELAISRVNGATILPGDLFSFNHRVGTFSRDQGYRRAPVSYDGQLIDDWGGGVCQVSTTLYNAALLAGMRIVERHHHEFAPGYVTPGRDAAVAYSNIDLRFANPYPFPLRISARRQGECLLIQFIADRALPVKPRVLVEVREFRPPMTYRVGDSTGLHRVRTSGASGCEAIVTRIMGDQTEEISHDEYPVMNRVVE